MSDTTTITAIAIDNAGNKSSTAAFTYTKISYLNVVSASPVNNTTLVVNFDQTVGTGANIATNYVIDGLTVSSAVVNGSSVTLTVSSMSTTNYDLTVNNVVSSAGAELDTNTTSFMGDGKPYVLSAISPDGNTVWIYFNEEMDSTTASVAANYSISPSVTITNAALDATDKTKVILTTGTQSTITYTVTVSHSVLDTNSNELTSPDSASFTGNDPTPKIISITCMAENIFRLTFSKDMQSSSASNISNYKINGSNSITISSVSMVGTNAVDITTSEQCNSDAVYTIILANAEDDDGFDNGSSKILDSTGINSIGSYPDDRIYKNGCGSNLCGPLTVDPFGDGTSFSYIFGFNNMIYLGPNKNNNGAIRMNPDATGIQNITFSIVKDTTDQWSKFSGKSRSSNSGPFDTFGIYPYTNDDAAGPDREEGVELFTVGEVNNVNYLFVGPRKTRWDYDPKYSNWGGDTRTEYLYYTDNTDTILDMKYLDCRKVWGDNNAQLAVVAMTTFNDEVIKGASGDGSYRPKLLKVPYINPQDINATTNNMYDLNARFIPDIGISAFYGVNKNNGDDDTLSIDSMMEFDGQLYVANNGGIARTKAGQEPTRCSDTTQCRTYWEGLFSQNLVINTGKSAYDNKRSVNLSEGFNLRPYKKAIPYMTTYTDPMTNQYLIFGRNVSNTGYDGGTQLFRLDTNDNLVMIANDGNNLTNMGDTNNKAISLVTVNGSYLYVGFDNTVTGFELYRTNKASPSAVSDFERVSTDGLGSGNTITRSFSSTSLQMGGYYYLYIVAGDNSNPIQIYRFKNL